MIETCVGSATPIWWVARGDTCVRRWTDRSALTQRPRRGDRLPYRYALDRHGAGATRSTPDRARQLRRTDASRTRRRRSHVPLRRHGDSITIELYLDDGTRVFGARTAVESSGFFGDIATTIAGDGYFYSGGANASETRARVFRASGSTQPAWRGRGALLGRVTDLVADSRHLPAELQYARAV